MFVGLLFYIPEQDDRQIGNSKLSAPSGSTLLVVVVIIVVIIFAFIVVILIFSLA